MDGRSAVLASVYGPSTYPHPLRLRRAFPSSRSDFRSQHMAPASVRTLLAKGTRASSGADAGCRRPRCSRRWAVRAWLCVRIADRSRSPHSRLAKNDSLRPLAIIGFLVILALAAGMTGIVTGLLAVSAVDKVHTYLPLHRALSDLAQLRPMNARTISVTVAVLTGLVMLALLNLELTPPPIERTFLVLTSAQSLG